MTEDYRAMCAELIEAVLSDDSHIDCVQIARRARALLDESEPAGSDIHYAWELEDAEGEWQAGGSANSLEDVQREGNRYLQTYSQDGPHKLIIQRHCVTTIEQLPDAL